MNLPAGSAGAIVSVVDYTNTFQTNSLTISPNGSEKIGGIASNFVAFTEGQSLTFVYVDGIEGWKNVQDSTSNATGNPFLVATGGTITTCGNDKIHTFTGPGTFTVSKVAECAANNLVSYLVVGGGGGGGSGDVSGGGGAGGYRELKSPSTPSYTASPLDGYPNAPNRITVTATSFPIAVGGGGAVGVSPPSPGSNGTNGVNSTFSTIAGAGGGGGARGCSSPPTAGGNGGSGGGASYSNSTGGGGSGNTPPTTPPQGQNGGGNANPSGGPAYGAGGGGGAGAVGGNGSPSVGGAGGNGVASSKFQVHQSQDLVVEVEQEMMLEQVVQEDLVVEALEVEMEQVMLLDVAQLTLAVVEVEKIMIHLVVEMVVQV